MTGLELRLENSSQKDEKKNIRKGICPNADSCKEYAPASYYCNKGREGIVIWNKIICYRP